MNTPHFAGPSKALSEFRNCFEACMTFDEALGCSGLSEKSAEVIATLRRFWDYLERTADSADPVESYLNASKGA